MARLAAAAGDPQAVVRRFCAADAVGARVAVLSWPNIAPLVSWALEPAWDHVVLITGYEVGSPRFQEGSDDTLVLPVRYSTAGQLSALGFDAVQQVEPVDLQLKVIDGEWRILGPPPAPHLSANRVDTDAMRHSLAEGGVNFVPNSLFVWQMFRSAGWNVDYQPANDVLTGTIYRVVDRPRAGDVVAYLRDGVPYHVGVVDAGTQVVSSTLNQGIVRSAIDAFGGEVRYLRLVQPAPVPVATLAEAAPASAQPTPTAVRSTPAARVQATQTAAVKRHRSAQPSRSRRVKRKKTRRGAHKVAPSRTP